MKIGYVVVFAFVALVTTVVTHADEEENIGTEVGQSLSDIKTMYGEGGVIHDVINNDGQNLDPIINPPETGSASSDTTESESE